MLDVVPVPPTITLLHDVTGFGEIGDGAVRAAFRDTEGRGDLSQPDAGVLGDAQQGTPRFVRKLESNPAN